MDRVTLAEGPPALVLTREDRELFGAIEDRDSQLIARFPVKASLLKAVGGGYSYQVGNEYGSLRFGLADNEIDVRYEGDAGTTARFKLNRLEFLDSVSILHTDNV